MSFAEGYKSSMGGPVEDKKGLDAIKAEGIKKGRQDAKNAGIKNTVNALSSGTGPMKTSGFGNAYEKASKRLEDAGGTKINMFTKVKGEYDFYYKKGQMRHHGMTYNEKYSDRQKVDTGAIPKAKDGVSIHKGPGGNIIENIEGIPGKTRDRAIIYKPTTSTQKQNIKRKVDIKEAKKLSFSVTPSLRTENLNGNIKSQVKKADKIAKKENVKNKKANKLADKSYNKELKQQRKKEKKALVKGYRASSGIKSAMSKKTFLAKKGF